MCLAALAVGPVTACDPAASPPELEVDAGPEELLTPDGQPAPLPDAGWGAEDAVPEARDTTRGEVEEVPLSITLLKVNPTQAILGQDLVTVTVTLRSAQLTTISGASLIVEARSPVTGTSYPRTAASVTIPARGTVSVTQQRGPFAAKGTWLLTAKLKDAAGGVLAQGPASATKLQVVDPPAPAITNPLSPVMAYQQINLSGKGSCASHSGAVSIGHLLKKKTVAEVLAMEKDIWFNYGGQSNAAGLKGSVDLTNVYNKYLAAKKHPWRATRFTSDDSVLGYLEKGSPVVSLTKLWDYGHYVSIYGLKKESGTWYVYFSDGAQQDGLSGVALPTGYRKKWPWATLKAHSKHQYIGFNR